MNLFEIGSREDLANTYQCFEYTPFMSTIMATRALFDKIFVLPELDDTTITQDRYYSLIDGTSIARLCVLLVPFLGNLAIWVYDSLYNDGDHILQNPAAFKDASGFLKSDKDFILDLVQEDTTILAHINPKLKRDIDFIIHVCLTAQDSKVIAYLDESLKNNSEKMELVYRSVENSEVIQYASEALRNNPEFMTKAIQYTCLKTSGSYGRKTWDENSLQTALNYLGNTLKSDPQFIDSLSNLKKSSSRL